MENEQQNSKIGLPKANNNGRSTKNKNLERWRQEKQERKNVEKLKEKPIFKVGKVRYDVPQFPQKQNHMPKNKQREAVPPKEVKPLDTKMPAKRKGHTTSPVDIQVPSTSGSNCRVTRSQSKALATSGGEVISKIPRRTTRKKTNFIAGKELPTIPEQSSSGPVARFTTNQSTVRNRDRTNAEDQEKEDNDTSDINEVGPKQEHHSLDENGKTIRYFRKLVKDEKARLLKQSREWMRMKSSVPDEIQDSIDSYDGQTNLFIRGRFRQFEGLITKCERQKGEKQITCTDLQGFWDMIYAQIQDLDKKFNQLRELRANDWKEKKETVNLKRVKKAPLQPEKDPTQPKKNDRYKNVKSNIRSLIQAERQKMKSSPVPVVEEARVFQGGYFKIDSPVRKSDAGPSLLNPASQMKGKSPTSSTSETKTMSQSETVTPKTPAGSTHMKSILKQSSSEQKTAAEYDKSARCHKVLFAEDVFDNSHQPELLLPLTPHRNLSRRSSTGSINITTILRVSQMGKSFFTSPLTEDNEKEFLSPPSEYQSMQDTLKSDTAAGEGKTEEEGILSPNCNDEDKENQPLKLTNPAVTDVELGVKVNPMQRTYSQRMAKLANTSDPLDGLASRSQNRGVKM